MHSLTIEQAADFLEFATIEQTTDIGHTIIHVGTLADDLRFVLINDIYGNTTVSVN